MRAAEITTEQMDDLIRRTVAWREAEEKTAEYRRAQRRFAAAMKKLNLDPLEHLQVHIGAVGIADAIIRGDATLRERIPANRSSNTGGE